MTAASQQIAGISFRGVQVLALNSLGIPAATSTTEYAGLRIVGAKALTINRPEWQNVYATGDDVILATFRLPPQEAETGELRVGALDMFAEALITGIPVTTQGEGKWLPSGVNLTELPKCCLLAWRDAESVASGDADRAHYQAALIPSATLAPGGGSFEERNVGERVMRVANNIVSKWPWGKTLALADEGGTTMQSADGSFEYIPRIVAFKGDGTDLLFTFTRDAVSTAKMKVYQVTSAGVYSDITSDANLTKAVGSLTWGSGHAIANGDFVIVVYEVAS